MLLERLDPSRLPEPHRVAFVGALTALAGADGTVSLPETLAVLEEVDLDGLSDEAVATVCASILDPPPFDAAIDALRAQPPPMLAEVMVRLLRVAAVDGRILAAETRALDHARERFGLGERLMRRVRRRSARDQRALEHGVDRAQRLDDWRNLLVTTAAFVVPFGVVLWLGLGTEVEAGPAFLAGFDRLAASSGLDPAAWGDGAVALVAVGLSMGLAAGAAALTSLVTLRGRRLAAIERDVHARARRVRANLAALVDHVGGRIARARNDAGARAAARRLEGRLQTLHTALVRLRS